VEKKSPILDSDNISNQRDIEITSIGYTISSLLWEISYRLSCPIEKLDPSYLAIWRAEPCPYAKYFISSP
jgi:hypothetical protein